MTLEQLKKEKPTKITINEAAAIMQINPQTLRIGLQLGKYPFGTATKRKRWVYWISVERFIAYMEARDMKGVA